MSIYFTDGLSEVFVRIVLKHTARVHVSNKNPSARLDRMDRRWQQQRLIQRGLILLLVGSGVLLLPHTVTSSSSQTERTRILKRGAIGGRSNRRQKVVFWHVSNTDEVVEDQLEEMAEKALKIADTIKWMAYAPTSQKALAKIRAMPRSSFQEIGVPARFKASNRSFFEFPTLVTLHQHCVEHPLDYVAYTHTKTKKAERRSMMRQLFGGPHCIAECLDKGKVACGVNLKKAVGGPSSGAFPSSWCHFSGNFWWASCIYVKTLNSPWADSLDKELMIENPRGFKGTSDKSRIDWKKIEKKDKHILHNHHDSRAYGRYFAEWWLLNDVRHDVVKSYSRPGKTVGAWLAAYEPDTNQVVRRSHIVKIQSPKECFLMGANEAVADVTCATDAARRLAAIHGAETIWRWPGTCPVALGFDNLSSAVCKSASF